METRCYSGVGCVEETESGSEIYEEGEEEDLIFFYDLFIERVQDEVALDRGRR